MLQLNVDQLTSIFRDRDIDGLHRIVVSGLSLAQPTDIVQHPLGFHHCNLFVDEGSGAQLRLHFWQKDCLQNGSALTPFHDHVWKLSSCVLYGELLNNIIRVDSDPNGNFTLETVRQDKSIGLDSVGSDGQRVSFSIEKTERIGMGMFYNIPPRQFHFSELGDCDTAISVVLSQFGVSGNPRTLMPLGAVPHSPTRQTIAGTAATADLMLSLLKQHHRKI